MALKLNTEGILIYCTMAAYLGAAIAMFFRARRIGGGLFFAGFCVAVAAFAVRWHHVNHVPLQNLYEVFLCLGMLIWPVSVFCRRFMGVAGEAADCIIGVIVLFPAGLIFKAEPQLLPPALQSDLFLPHVASYMAAYMILAKAGMQALAQLILPDPQGEGLVPYEQATYKMVRLGFPLLTVGLILGAVWGKIAWSDYWNWDPKELWSLISWLIFVGYLHVRYRYGRKFPAVNSSLVLAGLLAIIITLLWVNLSRIFGGGLHSYATS